MTLIFLTSPVRIETLRLRLLARGKNSGTGENVDQMMETRLGREREGQRGAGETTEDR